MQSAGMFCFDTLMTFVYAIITGCAIDLSSISISISDFSDCPIKKDYMYLQ